MACRGLLTIRPDRIYSEIGKIKPHQFYLEPENIHFVLTLMCLSYATEINARFDLFQNPHSIKYGLVKSPNCMHLRIYSFIGVLQKGPIKYACSFLPVT